MSSLVIYLNLLDFMSISHVALIKSVIRKKTHTSTLYEQVQLNKSITLVNSKNKTKE